jgi:hypothetical protein
VIGHFQLLLINQLFHYLEYLYEHELYILTVVDFGFEAWL